MTINGHFWVENDDGEVIFDPQFSQYSTICDIHQCDITKPVYQKASAERYRQNIAEHILPFMKQLTSSPDIIEKVKAVENPWEFNNCAMNVCFHKVVFKGEGKICFGDFGWEKQDGSGVFFEYDETPQDEWAIDYQRNVKRYIAELVKNHFGQEADTLPKKTKMKIAKLLKKCDDHFDFLQRFQRAFCS